MIISILRAVLGQRFYVAHAYPQSAPPQSKLFFPGCFYTPVLMVQMFCPLSPLLLLLSLLHMHTRSLMCSLIQFYLNIIISL